MNNIAEKEYYLVAVKSTRKPIILLSSVDYRTAMSVGDHYHAFYGLLSKNNMASSGVSIRIYDYLPEGAEIGDPDFVLGKSAVMSWGCV
jgi:hypothetical protein